MPFAAPLLGGLVGRDGDAPGIEVSLLGGFSYFAATNFNSWFGWEIPWIAFAVFAALLISVRDQARGSQPRAQPPPPAAMPGGMRRMILSKDPETPIRKMMTAAVM